MFSLPSLPYSLDALEPHISQEIMDVHYNKHHAGYTTKLNAAIKDTKYQDMTIEEILTRDPNTLPPAIRNNAGGYYNHNIFWENMTPNGSAPKESIDYIIKSDFGDFESFKKQFSDAAASLFGSGWAWLVKDSEDNLEIMTTPNQDNPLSFGKTPLLGLDVWEHAYYLQYKNLRPDYITAFWNVVDWENVNKRYIA